jgi:hypothetical protein
MIENPIGGELLQILRDLADELDVPPAKYKEAQDRYEAVGRWLNEDPMLKDRDVQIYPQGSFALGTVIRPLAEQDYDVDAICRLSYSEVELTQEQLKNKVGDRLKAHGTYSKMLDPQEGHRRCWRLQYSDGSQFHLDITPAIPDEGARWIRIGVAASIAQHAISITDKKTWNNGGSWPKSNAAGYVIWFKDRMRVMLNERLRNRAREINARVEEIKDYEVRTPLQRVIQLLKRHRDVRYGEDEDRPISIIITTLAAKAYQNESDIEQALFNIVPGMRKGIEKRGEDWWIPNPVNPLENFADKWKETPRKAQLFFEWLEAVEEEHGRLLTPEGFKKAGEYLSEAYGSREAGQVMSKYAIRNRGQLVRYGSAPQILHESIRELTSFDVPQRKSPTWPIVQINKVDISAKWRKAGRWLSLNSGYVLRGSDIRFEAKTNVSPPYDVYWQVVNTGKSARDNNDLRGDIFRDKEPTSLIHDEAARYRGRHWIECFIVKNNFCVARSGEVIVNIV